MNRRRVRLMRMTINTDLDLQNDPEYRGSFTAPIAIEENTEIVAADWSVLGECTLTLIVPAP